jgi:type II secretory pathway component PulF
VNRPTSPLSLAVVLITACVHVALWAGMFGEMVLFVPRLEVIYQDFNMKLPALSQHVVWLSLLVGQYPYVWALLPLVDLAILVYLYRRGNDLLLALWTAFIILLCLLVFLDIHVGLGLAVDKLHQGLHH